MGIPVSLKEVAEELDNLFDEMTAYINCKTGELYTTNEENTRLIEDEEDEDGDMPEWQRESAAKTKEVLDNDDWVALPGKFEIHEWEIMRDFAASVADPELSGSLVNAIHGKGAFRCFKDILYQHGIQEDWFRFKKQALMEIARAALDEAHIPYKEP